MQETGWASSGSRDRGSDQEQIGSGTEHQRGVPKGLHRWAAR